MAEVIYSGSNYFGVGALKSLFPYFNKIYIMSSCPADVREAARLQDEFIDNFNDADCKHVFLAGHIPFITSEQLARKTYINVHGSLLPRYRGMHPTFWAIFNGESELGITYHIVDRNMDSGDIIAQFSFPYNGEIVQVVNRSIERLIAQNSGKVVSDYCNGKIRPLPQDHDKATYGCKRNLDDCLIDFYWSHRDLEYFFKALTPPYPQPRLRIKGRIYEVTGHKLVRRKYLSAIGRVLNIDDEGIWIKTVDGFLVVSELRNTETDEIIDPRVIVKTGYRFISSRI